MSDDIQPPAELIKASIAKRHKLLKSISTNDMNQAWNCSAHLLLQSKASVAIMDCGDGAAAYALSVLRPELRILAMDGDKRSISRAKVLYRADNLQFQDGAGILAVKPPFHAGGFDAVISNHALHRVYSQEHYSDGAVIKSLATGCALLKNGGQLFVNDYLGQPFDYVIMEMPKTDCAGKTPETMSDIDFLQWFAKRTRPDGGAGCGGFFLEEIPIKKKTMRAFRLPYKWAHEFLLRRSSGKSRVDNIQTEYTAFTADEMRGHLKSLGMRLVYSAPQWKTFQDKDDLAPILYSEDGKELSDTPIGFVALAQKMADRASLSITERRPEPSNQSGISIVGMRNPKTDKVIDIASRGVEDVHDILPWHIDPETGHLLVWLHDAIAKGIVNTAPRKGHNIDGKRWSGHMVEPIALGDSAIEQALKDGCSSKTSAKRLAKNFLNMSLFKDSSLEKGPEVYPAPDQIQERVQTWFIDVKRPPAPVQPRGEINALQKFHARGEVRAFDAQGLLDAISAGLIPSAKLEIQLMALFAHVGLPTESRTQGILSLHSNKITTKKGLREWLDDREEKGDRFVGSSSSAGDLKAMRSIFVEDGRQGNAISGLASQDIDFVVPQEKTLNTAVVLAITKNIRGEIHAMVHLDRLPVPQRYTNSAKIMRLPAFNMPDSITTMKAAREFVAEKLNVLPEMIIELGASYYTHIGMTPQRVFPFAVADPPAIEKGQDSEFVSMCDISLSWRQLGDQNIMIAVTRFHKAMSMDMRLELRHKSSAMQAKSLEVRQGDKDFLPLFDGLPEIVPALPVEEKKEPPLILTNAWSAKPAKSAEPQDNQMDDNLIDDDLDPIYPTPQLRND